MNKTRRNIILIALAVVVIAVGGLGAYLVFGRSPEVRAQNFLESGKTYFEKGEYVKAKLRKNAVTSKAHTACCNGLSS